MSDIIRFETLENKLLRVRDALVLVDKDLAELFGVETKDINKAVKNNPHKFPDGYVIELTKEEFEVLRRKFSTAKYAKTRVLPKAFTEKGLYMVATILKSKNAINATKFEFNLGFAKVSRSIKKIKKGKEN